ncbi:MAG: DUF488 domain-containing protein [Desulfitobacterium hafniense]|nr:DUF488 domain-containing protein [Desulfitobacterium hafniense]
MKIYTIGFTKKSAEEFFDILERNKVKTVIDVRLNNSSQLAGFSKGRDLSYFLKKLVGINYVHRSDLAPTKEILDAYKSKLITWEQYETKFLNLLKDRKPIVDTSLFDQACLLCSEEVADHCHRRLVANYILDLITTDTPKIIHL